MLYWNSVSEGNYRLMRLMAHAEDTSHQALILSQQLLMSVAEQIKLPLLQIARQTELARLSGGIADLSHLQATADNALSLIDNYVLAIRLNLEADAQQLAIEPISVSSVLYDAGHQLSQYLRCEHEPGNFWPLRYGDGAP
jgi:hypothetical protein